MSLTAGCRILVLSAKVEHAEQFIQRVQALSGISVVAQLSSNEATSTVPWTIVNKYYTALVHFETRLVQAFRSSHAEGVPAVVYIWKQGDEYREYILDIANTLRHHDPEVSLAVQLGSSTVLNVDEEEGIDEFLSSHGFEYIEGDRGSCNSAKEVDRASEDEHTGIPGLPRVIDALSTIMWPSIVQSESTMNRKSRARELLDWAREEEEEDGLQALISDTAGASSSGDFNSKGERTKSRMQREMEELERWLEEEDEKREAENAQAWVTGERDINAGDWRDIPMPTIYTPSEDNHSYGFDDDFTEFVSAPSPTSLGALDSKGLMPMHTGASYRSLASVSDFGGEGELFVHSPNGDAEDPDLPSRAEIAETSRRIFGTFAPLPDPDIPHPSDSDHTLSPSENSDGQHSFEPDDDDDEFEMSAFDLSRVFSALQGMKEEISGMSDEGERRKAAARVALGLVYGLQADRDD